MTIRGGRGGCWRSRWAAIGAAVAVTFGAGGLVAVNAASSPESSVVTVTPARILDTRANLGLIGPFQRGVSRKVQVSGNVATTTGVRPVVPLGATGVLLNVTVSCVNRLGVVCQGGWLAVRPGDATGPTQTSSLNFLAGEIVPNSVQVGLPSVGNIDVVYGPYVPGAQVDVVIDVVGYMSTQLLDDVVWAMPFAKSARDDSEVISGPSANYIVSVELTAPFDGEVTVNTSTTASTEIAGARVVCWIASGEGGFDADYLQQWESPGPVGGRAQLAGTRVFSVEGDQVYTFGLGCLTEHPTLVDPSVALTDSVITAMYTPPY